MKKKSKARMDESKDIFDRIMGLPGLRILNPFYQKYREQLLYLFFGALTFFLNLFVFRLAERILPPLGANIIAWIAGVLFAYVSNRKWVFQSNVNSTGGVIRELVSFSTGRLMTLGLEELLLWVGIELLHFDSMPVKIAAQAAVIIGNYIVSKWFVFK